MKKPFRYPLAICVLFISLNSFATTLFLGDGNGDQTNISDNSAGWIQLFNGKNLDGWKHVGNGHMYVEDGMIKTHGGMGLLYWTGSKFGNCTIKVVYRMRDENSNAGFFIRIPIEPKEEWMPVYYAYEVQIDT